MIACTVEAISGCVVGIEHVYGGDLYDDNDSHYLSIDLIFFRLVFEFFNDQEPHHDPHNSRNRGFFYDCVIRTRSEF
jgi:hypothetical protein